MKLSVTKELNILPLTVTLEEFEVWKTCLISYLEVVEDYKMFLPAGFYSSWKSLSESTSGYRIETLHENDSCDMDQSNLLLVRNNQLSAMLNLIGSLAEDDEYSAIYNLSTSIDLIFHFLQDFRNLEQKYPQIFNLIQHRYKDREDYVQYYNNFRCVICDNLKKKGDKIGDIMILADEVLTPTFEEVILLWTLEKIDPHLPELVKDTFCHQLMTGTTLKDLEEDIFEIVPVLLSKTSTVVDTHGEYIDVKPDIMSENVDVKVDQKLIFESNHMEEMHDYLLQKSEDILDAENINEFYSETQSNTLKKYSNADIEYDELKPKILKDRKRKKRKQNCNDLVDTNGEEHSADPTSNVRTKMKCPKCNLDVSRAHIKSHMAFKHGVDFKLWEWKKLSEEEKCDMLATMPENIEARRKIKKKVHIKTDASVEARKLRKMRRKTKMNCPKCNVEMYREQMRRHMDKMHGIDFKMNKWKKLLLAAKAKSDPEVSPEPNERNLISPQKSEEELISQCLQKFASKERDFIQCTDCDERFPSRQLLRHHFCQKHGLKFSRNQWTMKLKQILGEDMLEEEICHHCGKSFLHPNLLENHLKVCKSKDKDDAEINKIRKKKKQVLNKDLHCQTCRRHFYNEKHMKEHKCAHLKCELCSAEFIRSRNLKIHMKGHNGAILFPCEECEGLFLSRKRLSSHKLTSHNPERRIYKHSCETCNSLFKSKRELINHQESVHVEERKFECEECHETYKTKGHLTLHKKREHDNGTQFYSCNDCGCMVGSVRELAHHRELARCKGSKS